MTLKQHQNLYTIDTFSKIIRYYLVNTRHNSNTIRLVYHTKSGTPYFADSVHSKHIAGFSLIELMTSLLLFSILMMFTVPGVATLIENNRISANTIDFLSALQFARSEAIKRGSRVTICIADASFNQCNSHGDWQNGWIIFADPDGNSITVKDPSRNILRVHQKLHGTQTSLALPSLAKGKDGSHISFTANGGANDQTTGRLGGWTFVLCDKRALSTSRKFARKIVVNQRGYARAVPANNDATGSDVSRCL